MNQVPYFLRATMLVLIFTALLWSEALYGCEIRHGEVKYRAIKWTALMPVDDLEALVNPHTYLNEINEGSRLDSLDMLLTGNLKDPRSVKYLKALNSIRVIEDFYNERIDIRGFIVPLSSDKKQNISECFIGLVTTC